MCLQDRIQFLASTHRIVWSTQECDNMCWTYQKSHAVCECHSEELAGGPTNGHHVGEDGQVCEETNERCTRTAHASVLQPRCC